MQFLLKEKDSSALCRDHANLHCILSVEEKLDFTAGLLRDTRTIGRYQCFAPSRTQWAVSLAEDEAVTHQEHSQILHSWRQATCATFGLCVSLRHLLPSLSS